MFKGNVRSRTRILDIGREFYFLALSSYSAELFHHFENSNNGVISEELFKMLNVFLR